MVGLVFMSASLKFVPFLANIFSLSSSVWRVNIVHTYTVACSVFQCLVQGFVPYKVVYNGEVCFSSNI